MHWDIEKKDELFFWEKGLSFLRFIGGLGEVLRFVKSHKQTIAFGPDMNMSSSKQI